MEELYLSNIITDQDLANIHAGEFNILCAPPGYGKTTFSLDDKILNFARNKKHVLYLVHNRTTRDSIASLHPDRVKIFQDNNCNGWFEHRRAGVWTTEADEEFVHIMCYQTFAALLRNEGTQWLDDIDLIVWDEFDDIKSFYEGEVKKLQKVLPEFSKEELVSIIQRGNSRSVVNFVYQIKTFVLDPSRIKLLAISATPECAALYFGEYVNYILNGHLEWKYVAEQTFFIKSVKEAAREGLFNHMEGKKYWCYTRFISDALELELVFRDLGYTPIVMWSDSNPNYRSLYTPDKKEAEKSITEKGIVPPQYDCVITTGIIGRSINVYDTSYQNWICDSTEYEDLHQFLRARFCPEKQFLLESARGLVEFVQGGFPAVYYEWHTLEEMKQLLVDKPVMTQEVEPQRIKTIQALKRAYPARVEQKQFGKTKKTMYRIIGGNNNDVKENANCT